MRHIATVAHIGRYPVKSMRGQAPLAAAVGWNGLLGDRRYAFVRGDTTAAFPWLTGRQDAELLLYTPDLEAEPTPDEPDPAVWVETPGGQRMAVDDPALRQQLEARFGHPLFLLHSGGGAFDSSAVSLFSLASLRELSRLTGRALERQRFRANLYIEPLGGEPWVEEEWQGRGLRIGDEVRLAVTRRNKRCVMTTLDPATSASAPEVLRTIVQQREECAGVYAVVLARGWVHAGDPIYLEDE